MSKVSVLIPARKELYIRETVRDLFDNRSGAIEVIVILDGDTPEYKLPRKKGLKVLRNKTVKGMRPSINDAAAIATGDYLMKLDAHCTVGEGWDEILKADCADNWIVVPRRYWLDAPKWEVIPFKLIHGKPMEYVDAMAYLYPFYRPYCPRLTARPWREYANKHKDEMVVEDMSFQGSCWFMTKKHFNRLGGMDAKGYGTFGEEAQDIGLRTQLGPWQGAIMRNKKTWYAHWSKPSSHWKADPEVAGRVTNEERENGYKFCFDFWWYDRWDEQVRDFKWLVDKFWPLPGWPENWKWLTTQYNRYDKESMAPLWIE